MCQRGALRVCDVPVGCIEGRYLMCQRGALNVCDVPERCIEGV